MSDPTEILREVGNLKRFSHLFRGSYSRGDKNIEVFVKELTSGRMMIEEGSSLRVGLYRALLHSYWKEEAGESFSTLLVDERRDHINGEKVVLPRQMRLAFLLSYFERFTSQEVQQILEIDEGELQDLLATSHTEICHQLSANVLIIEDELFIAMELEEIVNGLGHWVLGIARTRSEVTKALTDLDRYVLKPGLILADIQLADGSSGIDAVNDHAARSRIPVIFITAYPDRLIDRTERESTYVLKKPFTTAALRSTISQALYFSSTVAQY